jgi:hypothetical protein
MAHYLLLIPSQFFGFMIVFYEALCYRCEVSVAGVETGGGLLCFLFIIVLAGGRGRGGGGRG